MVGLGLSHSGQYTPLPGFRYSKYREPEKVSWELQFLSVGKMKSGDTIPLSFYRGEGSYLSECHT